MSARTDHLIIDVQSATGVTTVTCGSYTTTTGFSYQYWASVIGRDTVTGDIFECVRYGGARNVGAVLTIVGGVRALTDNADASVSGAVVTLDAQSQVLRVRCTGVAVQTIEFMTRLAIMIN